MKFETNNIIIGLVYAVLVAIIIVQHIDIKTMETSLQRADMYKNGNLSILGGYYHTDGYYCVWTADKTPEQIASTQNEEICHNLVDRDYRHFCGPWK